MEGIHPFMAKICKNCGTEFSGNYCNNCGQKAKVGRLTFRSVIDNWAYGLTNCDTGILYTCKELFTRSGHMVADYIRGKRVIYFQPFPMLFITAGLYGLISQIFLPEKEIEVAPIATELTFWGRFFQLLAYWASTSMSFVAIATLPIFAWAARYTFYTPYFHPFRPSYKKSISDWFYCHLVSLKIKKNYTPVLSDYWFISTYIDRMKCLAKLQKYPYNFTEYIFIFAYIACQRLIIALFIGIPLTLYMSADQPQVKTDLLQIDKEGGAGISLYLLYFAVMVWDIKQLFRLRFLKAFWKTFLLLLYGALIMLLLTLLLSGIIIGIIYILGTFGFIPMELVKDILN